MEVLFSIFIAGLNIAAGRRLFGLTKSTQISRIAFAILASLPLALIEGSIWFFVGLTVLLYIWRLEEMELAGIHGRKSGWRDSGKEWFHWVSDKVWPIDPQEGMETRLKATLDQAVRMSLIIPAIAFTALYMGNYVGLIYCLVFPLMGGAYFLGGVPKEHKYSVWVAEAISGFIIGLALWGAM